MLSYTTFPMANKKLRITEEAYNTLINSKKPEESFSDYILRYYRENSKNKKKDISQGLRD